MSSDQTVIVQAPKPANSETSENGSKPPVEQAINQAEQFGAMREAFHSTQNEVAAIRSELEGGKGNQTMLVERLDRLEQQQSRLLAALEEEKEEEIEAASLPEGTTVIVPPALEETKEEETPPKKSQTWANRLLFGREDE